MDVTLMLVIAFFIGFFLSRYVELDFKAPWKVQKEVIR